jgi:predicted metal-dependent HD superfamily phosphohydrolase
MHDRLEASWRRLYARADRDAVFQDLVRRYSEPHRAYHTLSHIDHCLQEFEATRDTAEDREAVELALWFHDAVYKARASDNEERSADLVRPISRRAAELVLATRHAAPPEDPDAQLVVDIDLAILGQPVDRFDRYEQEIRKEYAWVPGFLFRRKRAAVLRSFIERGTIFHTPHFRNRYEAAARANLERSLAKL